METDLYRKFCRISQFSKTNDPIADKKALENNYLDVINYCVLQLVFLRHHYWGEFSWEAIDPKSLKQNGVSTPVGIIEDRGNTHDYEDRSFLP